MKKITILVDDACANSKSFLEMKDVLEEAKIMDKLIEDPERDSGYCVGACGTCWWNIEDLPGTTDIPLAADAFDQFETMEAAIAFLEEKRFENEGY